MRQVEDDDDADELPYTLPPPPYSPSKPDNSYAALVGQAILSSPDHRLTLQEIYEWITTVYPYFKRGETTWMNSIRHVLSTTVVFRKVVRDRAIGRTLWAIWDEDLECFEGGGFRKQFCKDMVDQGKGGQKKRPANTEDDSPTKRAKRARKTQSMGAIHQPYILPSIPPSHSMPLFPPTRPTPHHQPYYESCHPQSLPAEIIFPPLPTSSNYHRVCSVYASSAASTSTSHLSIPSDDVTDPSSASPPPSSSASSFSLSAIPELTPNRNSSSPPLSSEANSANSSANFGYGNIVVTITNDDELDDRGNRMDDDAHPDLDTVMEALEPSITLLNRENVRKGKQKFQPRVRQYFITLMSL
jgi:hypothetical protein